MVGIKARESAVLGLWWRWAVWMERMGPRGQMAVLLCAYVVYRVLSTGLKEGGNTDLVALVELGWIGMCAYSWSAPVLFERLVRAEIEPVQMHGDF